MKKGLLIFASILIFVFIFLINVLYLNNNNFLKFITEKSDSDSSIILDLDIGTINTFDRKQYFIKPKNKSIFVKYKGEKHTVLEALDKKIITREDMELQTEHIIIVGIFDFTDGIKTNFYEDDKYIYSYSGTYDYNLMYKRTNNTFQMALNKGIIDLDILYEILPFDVEVKKTGEMIEYEKIR